jgi:hypothetical protein
MTKPLPSIGDWRGSAAAVEEADLRYEAFVAGKTGQGRLTHIPTGLVEEFEWATRAEKNAKKRNALYTLAARIIAMRESS